MFHYDPPLPLAARAQGLAAPRRPSGPLTRPLAWPTLGGPAAKAPGWFLYISLVYLSPPDDPACRSTRQTSGRGGLGSRGVAEPRRVLIDWDYGAHGIWWVPAQEEKEALAPPGRWSGAVPPHPRQRRPWSDRLSSELLDDLQEWNNAWNSNYAH